MKLNDASFIWEVSTVLVVWGWVLNLIALMDLASSSDPNILMGIIRLIGIFVFPLGAILGFFF